MREKLFLLRSTGRIVPVAESVQTILVPCVSAALYKKTIRHWQWLNIFTYRNKHLAKKENKNVSFLWRLNRFVIFAQEDLEVIKKKSQARNRL